GPGTRDVLAWRHRVTAYPLSATRRHARIEPSRGAAAAGRLGCCDEPCRAPSAAFARSCRAAKNCGDWPMNSPLAVSALAAPRGAPRVSVERMIEHAGNTRP